MPELNDHELLAEFVRTESGTAFATLVACHVNLVYSTALRFTGNPHHAEEITQAVFIILARKAGKLSPRIVLSGWLYQAARLTAANLVKGETRRHHREQEAYMQTILNEPDAMTWKQIAPLLDDAMGGLGETDRNALVLRFFENKTAAEVAAALKLTEAAAQKRVNRALEKLRKFFTKRGVSSTTAIIAGAISANSVQAAPVALAKSVTAVAIVKGSIAATSTLTLVKGTMKTLNWLKAKFALVVGTTALLTGGVVTVAISQTNVNGIITLNGGSKLTLLGMTVGTRQMAPGYEKLATANWYFTPKKTPMLWIKSENESNQWSTYEIVVYDKAKTACVNLEKSTGSHVSPGVDIQGFVLNAFPRWDKEFIVRVRPYRGKFSPGQFIVSNPAPVIEVTNWIADRLPAIKSDGDLEVTLNKFVVGATTPSWAGGSLMPTNDPANQCVHLNFDFRQNGQSTTNWYPWPVQTTDAAGNQSRGLIYDYPTNGIRRIWGYMKNGSYIPPPEHYGMDGYYFQPGLWPNQLWKVRLEFIQCAGFSDDEIVTFTNLAVMAGNQQDADNEWTWEDGQTNFKYVANGMVNGVKWKLLPPLLIPDRDHPGQKRISVDIHADSSPIARIMNLTLLRATDENGKEVATPFRGGGMAPHFVLDFPDARDIKTISLKLALHKSRFVEFTVNPSKE